MQSISSSPARQAIFAQEKLEKIYVKTHGYLRPYKGAIELAQDVLVWKKPVASALLYIAVHWVFILYVKSEATLLTAIGNLIFWGLVADVLWRAATKEGFKNGSPNDDRERRSAPSSRRRLERTPNLESALLYSHRPRGVGELPSFEVVCVWVAEGVMWVDNLWLALRHWSLHDPVIFTFALAIPGLGLSLVGKYIPFTVFLYIQVISLLVVPYVEHHCLRQQLLDYLSQKYPWVLHKAHSIWVFIKAITVNRDRSEDPELSLAQGLDELRTQASLQEAFDQVTTRPPQQQADDSELELSSPSEMGNREDAPPREGARDLGTQPSTNQSRAVPQRRVRVLPTLPQTSNDSLTLDSFVGGPENEFPSITDLDSSLALPQFPSGDYADHSTSMPTITEQEEPARAQDTTERNAPQPPHTTSHSNPYAHPLSQVHRAEPTQLRPSAPPLTSGFDNLGFSMYTSVGQTSFPDQTSSSGYIPPPTYQQVETGSPAAGVVLDWTPPGREEGPVPERSSTPNVESGSETWGMKKRPSSGIY